MKFSIYDLFLGLIILSITPPIIAMEHADKNSNNKMEKGEKEKDEVPSEAEKKEREERNKRVQQRLDAIKKKHAQQSKKAEENNKIGENENVGESCPICQETLKKNACITLHNAGDKFPHAFHTWCLYNWCKQDKKDGELLDDLEKGCKSDKYIAIACPICHEEDTTQKPLPKVREWDEKEKLQYPPKKFNLSVAELCTGAVEYLGKMSLKERFEGLENLPKETIITTLEQLAALTMAERKKIYENSKENDLTIQRIVLQKIIQKDAPKAWIKEIEIRGVQAAISLLDDRPLAKEFVKQIFEHLDDSQLVICFKRAFDCQDLLLKEPLSYLLEIEARVQENNSNGGINNESDSSNDEEYVAAEDVMPAVDCYTSIIFYSAFSENLSPELQKEYFGKLLEKKARKPQLKWLLLGETVLELYPDVQLAYFDGIYPHINYRCRTILLTSLKKSLIEKNGLEAVCLLVRAIIDDENAHLKEKRALMEAYWEECFENTSLSERLNVLELLPNNILLGTIKEFSELTAEQQEKIFVDATILSFRVQRAIGIVLLSEEEEEIDGEYKEMLIETGLKIVKKTPIYKDFLSAVISNIPIDQRSAYFEKAMENDKPLYTDKELFSMAEKDDFYHDNWEEQLAEMRSGLAIFFYTACLPHLPSDMQSHYLKIFLDKPLDQEAQRQSIKRLSETLSPDVLVAQFDNLYPLLSANKKVKLLIRCKKELLETSNKENIAMLLEQIDSNNLPLESLCNLLEIYWNELPHKCRLNILSTGFEESIIDETRRAYMAPYVRTILERLEEDELPTYVALINDKNDSNQDCKIAILEELSHTATPKGKKAFYVLYEYIQKNCKSPYKDGTRMKIFEQLWPKLSTAEDKNFIFNATFNNLEFVANRKDLFDTYEHGLSQATWLTCLASLLKNIITNVDRIEIFKSYWGKIPTHSRGHAFAILLQTLESKSTYYKTLVDLLKEFRPYTPQEIIDDWFSKKEQKEITCFSRYELLETYWPYLSKRQRLISTAPLLSYKEYSKLLLEKLKTPMPTKLIEELLKEQEAAKQLEILKKYWPPIEQKFRIGGLEMAIALIKTEPQKIFEVVEPASWLPQCSSREKRKLLRFLWNEGPKNRLAHFQLVFDCCNKDEKETLKKHYNKKVACTTNALSLAANLLTNTMPSFLAPKNGSLIPQKDEKILRDVPSKTAPFTSSFGMSSAISAGKKAVLGWLGFGKKEKKIDLKKTGNILKPTMGQN